MKETKYSSNGYVNRAALKGAAREKLKGNLWNLWKPLLILMAIGFVLGVFSGVSDPEEFNPVVGIVEFISSILMIPLSAGLILYMLNFVRGKKYDIHDLFTFFDKRFFTLLLIDIVVGLFVTLWSILFIIPGIIAALSYSMCVYVYVDETKTDVMEVLKESKRLMNGHKWEYFVFGLSFIGWFFLVAITFGIAAIYVVPYMNVAQTMYYEEIKSINK